MSSLPWRIAGVSGVAREREWDASGVARAPAVPGDEVHFVALPDGTLVVDEDVPDGVLEPLATAVESSIEPPYRAVGVRRSPAVWAVGADRIDVFALPETVEGEELELVVHRGERTYRVDGRPAFPAPLEIEAVGRRHGEDYVIRARRIDETLWEADVAAL